ncbi:unnamed protein product [Aureobasidium mustum]|uniref:Protein kinase domain-containing protein n=1 Tax=Aureobasidium mustum TaxID=2773714 RepID=A0A9N8KB48_9PEZI|nr:unnamed protein product [Aureobasidium mustum]
MHVNISTTEPTAVQSQLSTEASDRVKIVYLSGPIKMILPINERGDTKSPDQYQCYLHPETFASFVDSADATINETVLRRGPTSVEPRVGDCDKVSSTDSPSNKHTTNSFSPAMEADSSSTKQADCNYPDKTLSPFVSALHPDEEHNLTKGTSSCPYIPGNEILLKNSESDDPIKAVIVKCFPATLSCCMVIRFIEPPVFNHTSECVLKLYDRRFSAQHREDWEAPRWSPELEKEYQDFVECGDAEEFFSYWDAEKERDGDWSAAYVGNHDRWSVAKREAYLQWDATNTYETEKKAYEHMAKLQGEDAPKVFGEVVLGQPAAFQKQSDDGEAGEDEAESIHEDSKSTTSTDADNNPQTVDIPGILIQYIDGFHLTDLHEHLPQHCWQSIVDTAIGKLHHIQECGILNRDVNTRSFMVDPLTHKVMMIDFGIVLFREDFEDDREWEMLQAEEDEEGAVGLLMQTCLKERGGGSITYKPSEHYWRLKYRFRGMEGEREGGTEEEEEYLKKHKAFVFE